jgi:hypothetical protein
MLSAQDLQDNTFSVSICIPLGQTGLQREPIRATGMQSGGARNARNKRDMGTPHSKWFLHRQHVGALPMS